MFPHLLQFCNDIIIDRKRYIGQKTLDAGFKTLKTKTMKIHYRIRNIASTVNE
jgi:hypothetical protein